MVDRRLPGNSAKLGTRPVDGHTSLQPPDRVEPTVAPTHSTRQDVLTPDLRGRRILEARRHHADNRECAHPVERDSFTDHAWLTRELPQPQPMADHNLRMPGIFPRIAASRGPALLGEESAPEDGDYAEDVEERRRAERRLQPLGRAAGRDQRQGRSIERQGLERRAALAPIEKASGEHLEPLQAPFRTALPQPHDLLRPIVRQGPEDDALEHREDRDRRPDTQRQRTDGHAREAGIVSKRAPRVAQITDDDLHEWQPSLIAPPFFRGLDAAESQKCRPACAIGVHACTNVVLGEQLDVELDFVAELVVSRRWLHGFAQATPQSIERPHHVSVFSAKNFAMMSVVCSQCCRWDASWRRPVFVMR